MSTELVAAERSTGDGLKQVFGNSMTCVKNKRRQRGTWEHRQGTVGENEIHNGNKAV